MSKRMKVLISVLVAMLLLTIGGTAMAMAQEEEEPEEEVVLDDELPIEIEGLMLQVEPDGLLPRVAEILGIPEEELIDAFKQARQEVREEAFYQALDKAVVEGLLTQEEADEIKEWWEQKPEALNFNMLRRAFGFRAPHPKHLLGSGQGMPSEIKQHLRQRLEQLPLPEMRQRVWQNINRGWPQPGLPWLAD